MGNHHSVRGGSKNAGAQSIRWTSGPAIVLYLAAFKLIFQLLCASKYGFDGDELYYASCSEHLDWGYFDHPPLIDLATFVARHVFGDSLIGKLRIEPCCIDIGELARQAIAMMQPTADEKGVRLEAALDPTVPLVYSDPDRTLEVLINLIDNGIKFTPAQGAVSVKASLVETDPTSVYVSISDSGRGIPAESIQHVFERLYQDPDAVDGSRAGLGLGLYIAKEIVTLHGGRMWVASEAGTGSTFSFTLPLYSLAKLLLPLITHLGRLREAIVLVRVELTALPNALRGSWRETCQQCLELLRKCIYLDKDLVLPRMGTNGPVETFYVVASTDMERVNIMMERIRGQIGALPKLKATGVLRVTAENIPCPDVTDAGTLEQKVWGIADHVTGIVQQGLGNQEQKNLKDKENHNHAK